MSKKQLHTSSWEEDAKERYLQLERMVIECSNVLIRNHKVELFVEKMCKEYYFVRHENTRESFSDICRAFGIWDNMRSTFNGFRIIPGMCDERKDHVSGTPKEFLDIAWEFFEVPFELDLREPTLKTWRYDLSPFKADQMGIRVLLDEEPDLMGYHQRTNQVIAAEIQGWVEGNYNANKKKFEEGNQ